MKKSIRFLLIVVTLAALLSVVACVVLSVTYEVTKEEFLGLCLASAVGIFITVSGYSYIHTSRQRQMYVNKPQRL